MVSDYDAISMIHNYHYVAETKQKAAALALNAGIDVELPIVDCYGDPLKQALEDGDINLELLDTAVGRHLSKKFELGLMDNPYANEETALADFQAGEDRALARRIASKGMVLLKNDGILPLETGKKIALIGPHAKDGRVLLGDYTHQAKIELVTFLQHGDSSLIDSAASKTDFGPTRVVTYLEGLQNQIGSGEVLYAQGCEINSDKRDGFAAAVDTAKNSDFVVLVLGDKSGLVQDATSGETRDSATLKLPGVQEDLAKEILALGKPTVLVLASGRPYEILSLHESANAILHVWITGEEGGNALADVLFGAVNPAGRLPITYPRSVGQIPLNYDHTPSGAYSNWYENYMDESIKPLYPFGHGLSYTQFEYSNLTINQNKVKPGEIVQISMDVKNTGLLAGEEVVQLYLRDEYGTSPRPLKELKGFTRFELDSGEIKRVHFDLPVNQLAFYNPDLELKVEAGSFKLMIGASSDDIRLEGAFEVLETQTLKSKERVLNCPVRVEASEKA